MSIPPQSVVSPKGMLGLPLSVVHTTPEWSLATAFWAGERCLLIRWNGEAGSPLGNPVVEGEPSWFPLPALLFWQVLSVAADDTRIAAISWLHEGKDTEGTPTHGDTAA